MQNYRNNKDKRKTVSNKENHEIVSLFFNQ